MNATQTKLLAEADRMSESMLVRMEDWELAYLRVAMRNRVEQMLNAELFGGEPNEARTRVSTRPDQPAQLVEAAR